MTAHKPTTVPRLRFPEFQDAPDWKTGRCRDIAKVLPGYGFPDKFQGNKKGQYPFYKVSDISHTIEKGQRYISEANNYIDSDVLDTIRGKSVPAGTIIFAKIGEAIRSNRRVITTKPAVIDNNTAGVKALKAKSFDEFLFYLWSNVSLIDHAGGVVPAVSKSALESVPLCYPSDPAEQQRIADCLGSLDDLIAADGRKLEALRQHKQGLMQQLFPQPGETRPRLRFPEFEDAPDWEEVTLGTLLDRPPDYGVNAAAVPFSESLPTYIRITDINDDGQFASRARVSVDIDATDEQYLEDGDIVLARTGASVGKSYRYREEDGRLVYAGFLIRVRPSPERLLSQFLAAYLSTWSYWDWVRLTSERSGQPGVNATEYASIPLPLPPDRRTLAEQQKIADCLTSIDDQLNAQARKLDTLKQHKQGLQQQLFPSLDGQ